MNGDVHAQITVVTSLDLFPVLILPNFSVPWFMLCVLCHWFLCSNLCSVVELVVRRVSFPVWDCHPLWASQLVCAQPPYVLVYWDVHWSHLWLASLMLDDCMLLFLFLRHSVLCLTQIKFSNVVHWCCFIVRYLGFSTIVAKCAQFWIKGVVLSHRPAGQPRSAVPHKASHFYFKQW